MARNGEHFFMCFLAIKIIIKKTPGLAGGTSRRGSWRTKGLALGKTWDCQSLKVQAGIVKWDLEQDIGS
jgi:hypothetical protein